jgi:type II secretory pathway pseudopilin PulG
METARTAQRLVHHLLMWRRGPPPFISLPAAAMVTATEARGQGGFTLVEVSVVLTTMLVIVASFLGALNSLTNTGLRIQALVNNQETVRFGLDRLQRDLRAANPVDAPSTTSEYGNAIRIELGPNPGTRVYIRWFYDRTPTSSTYESLLRQVMSGNVANATVISQVAVITRVRNVETNTALFTYYDSGGNDLVAGNPTTPANVANCAIRVHVQVDSDAQPGPQPFSENIDVELRNRLPGGIIGCAT